MRRFFKKKTFNILEHYESEAHGTMEVQRLFTSLFGKGESSNGLRSLMVTSAMAKEGKSTLVGNLALVAAHGGVHTVIVDADMRHPSQHGMFQPMPSSPGLSDYLQKEAEFDQVIHDTGLDNLKIIPCGSRVSSPGGLLQINVSDFKILLQQCHVHFDVVLIDVPPVIPVTDAELIGPLVDGVLMVVRAGKTYREITQRALQLLGRLNCNVVGIALNNVGGVLPYYYEQKYYRYSSTPIKPK